MTKSEIFAKVVILKGMELSEAEIANYVKKHTKAELEAELKDAMGEVSAFAVMVEDDEAEAEEVAEAVEHAPEVVEAEQTEEEQILATLGMDAKCLNGVVKSARMELGKLKHAINALKSILDEAYDYEYKKRTYHGTYRQFLHTVGAFNHNGDLTPASILSCIKFKDEFGKACFNKNVSGMLFTENDDKKHDKVYAWNGKEWKTVRKYKSVAIEDNKWSAVLILAAIVQGVRYNTEVAAIEKSAKAFEDIKEVYTFKKQTNKGGEKNQAIKAKKELVMF